MYFHDLQHDYLALYAEDPPLLHADLLAAYWFFFVTLRMDGGSSLKSPISGITFSPSSRGWENHHNGNRPGLSNAADCDGWSACCADPTLPWPRLRNRTIFLASGVGPRARSIRCDSRSRFRCSPGDRCIEEDVVRHAQAHAPQLPCSSGPPAEIGVRWLPVPAGGDRARSALAPPLRTLLSRC
jgi:hypothetical protein